MFIIRADGNTKIGMGHIMRCLSIADAMKQLGTEAVFVTGYEQGVSVIQERGYTARLLETEGEEIEAEIASLSQMLPKEEKNLILVDSYRATRTYFERLGELCGVACLEDMGQAYPVNLLINYNIYGTQFADNYRRQAQEVLLGAAYVPLRREFVEEVSYQVREKVQDIVITTGGSDPLFASRKFLEVLLADGELAAEEIRIHVICGPFHGYKEELREAYKGNPRVYIHENVTSMKEILSQSDVVITAAGSTVYEVSAMGIPMICFYFADNQKRGAQRLAEVTAVVNCGDFALDAEECAAQILEAVQNCVHNPAYRKQLSEEERKLVDGGGALKIAHALQKLLVGGE